MKLCYLFCIAAAIAFFAFCVESARIPKTTRDAIESFANNACARETVKCHAAVDAQGGSFSQEARIQMKAACTAQQGACIAAKTEQRRSEIASRKARVPKAKQQVQARASPVNANGAHPVPKA